MSSLLGKWLANYDPIHRGFTPRGIAMGLTLTAGFGFVATKGMTLLYRGKDDTENIDWTNPVGAAASDATTIRNFAWRPHSPSTLYAYGVRAVGGGGVEESADHNIVVAEFDGGGAIRPAVPHAPLVLTTTPIAGGKILLDWAYSAAGQPAAASEFRVYHDNGTGTMDFATPIGTVSFVAGRTLYDFTTGAYSHGTKVQFAVRAATAAGDEELNADLVVEAAVATPPSGFSFVHAAEGVEE